MAAIAPIERAIKDIAAGRMVILVDDEDRENEGDLVIAADHVSPEAINFMAKHGRGLICLTLTRERCQQINLPLWCAITAPPWAPISPSRSKQLAESLLAFLLPTVPTQFQ